MYKVKNKCLKLIRFLNYLINVNKNIYEMFIVTSIKLFFLLI